jgi:hypothetical protein
MKEAANSGEKRRVEIGVAVNCAGRYWPVKFILLANFLIGSEQTLRSLMIFQMGGWLGGGIDIYPFNTLINKDI